MSSPEEESRGPVIRDRRRIDPATGQVREPAEPGPHGGPGGPGSQPKPGGPASQPRPGRPPGSKPGGGASGSAGPADAAGPAPAQASTPGRGPASGDAAGANGGARTDAIAAQTALAERTADLQRLQAEYANYRKRVERDRLAVREQALANVLNELLPVLDDIGRAREHGELTGGFKSVADSLESVVAKLGLTSYGESGDPFDPTLHEALMHEYSAEVTEPTCVRILQPGYKVGDRIVRPARVAVAEPAGEDATPPEPDDVEPIQSATEDDGADGADT